MIYIKSVYFEKDIEDKSSYEFKIPSIKEFINNGKELKFDRDITFFVGENGIGKSTLLESIAVAYGFNPEGGSKNFNFSTKDTHSKLFEHMIINKAPYKSKDGFFIDRKVFIM